MIHPYCNFKNISVLIVLAFIAAAIIFLIKERRGLLTKKDQPQNIELAEKDEQPKGEKSLSHK
jgi:hypothetical protein